MHALEGDNEDRSTVARIQAERNKSQETSWYLLLDLVDFLQSHFGESFWTTLAIPNQTQQPFRALQQTRLPAALVSELNDQTRHPSVSGLASLSDALIRVRSYAARLETASKSYTGYGPRPTNSGEAAAWDAETKAMWPDFLFPLVDVDQFNPSPFSTNPKDRMPTLRIAQPPGSLDPSLTMARSLEETH